MRNAGLEEAQAGIKIAGRRNSSWLNDLQMGQSTTGQIDGGTLPILQSTV